MILVMVDMVLIELWNIQMTFGTNDSKFLILVMDHPTFRRNLYIGYKTTRQLLG